MLHDIDLWMKLATESGMEVLGFIFSSYGLNKDEYEWYTFPAGVLEAKSLSKLKLTGGVGFDQVVLNHSIKDFSLRELHLNSVLFGDEGIIEHLISRCPLIEQITLKHCAVYEPLSTGGLPRRRMLKSLSIKGLKKLKGVEVLGIQEVSIDAPNLENLCYIHIPDDDYAPFELNFDSCRNLRWLVLTSYRRNNVIGDKWLLELFSNSPFLESLRLESCNMSERINISSAQLKVLELSHCPNLKEVNIDAPNLLSCVYYGYGSNIPVIYFLRSSSKLEFNAVIIDMDFLDLCNLREIIKNFKPHKVLASLSLSIDDDEPDVIMLDELIPDLLQVSSPLPSVKHLKLEDVPRHNDLYLRLVSLLLSGCCPETISVGLYSDYCEAFAEFLLELLMGGNWDKCYCSSGHTKCWWHDLKNVKATRSVETTYFKDELDDEWACPPKKIINFRLEL